MEASVEIAGIIPPDTLIANHFYEVSAKMTGVWRLIVMATCYASLSWAQAIRPELVELDGLLSSGRYAEALPRLEKYVAEHPDSATAQYQLGYVYYRLHRVMPSVKALSASLSLDVSNADAHRVLGAALTILQKLDLAEREFKQAIALDPRNSESHYALGRVHYERGAYADAAIEFQTALPLGSSSFKVHQSLGLTFEALNDLPRARAHLEQAVELNQRQAKPSEWPLINLASFSNRRGEYEQATGLLRRALELAPGSETAHFQLAKAYRGLGKWKECAEELQAAIRLAPNNPEFFYTLAIAMRRLGNLREAQTAMEQFERLKRSETSAQRSSEEVIE